MTQEDKDLLIKDLCARLPYGVKVRIEGDYFYDEREPYDAILKPEVLGHLIADAYSVKPYLRPMSSMTDEEGKDLEHIFSEIEVSCWVDTEYGCVNFAGGNDFIDTEIAEVYTDWLNKNHFDYRGLIPMGLALEAPKDMYKNE